MFRVILDVEVIIGQQIVDERQFSFTANIPAPRHVLVVSFLFSYRCGICQKHKLHYNLCSHCPA